MKIAYVGAAPKSAEEVERRGRLLQQWAASGTTIEMAYATEGPASIESMYEEYIAIPQYAKNMVRLEREGFAAAIVGCAGDPGIDVYRELCTNMLVVGPGMSGFHAAALLGRKFTLLTVADSMIASSYELIQKSGLASSVASVLAVNIPVLELSHNRTQTLEKLVRIGRDAIEKDRADVLVLGCMSMAFLQVAEDMQKQLGIPVINPAKAALKLAESLVSCGLKQSKNMMGESSNEYHLQKHGKNAAGRYQFGCFKGYPGKVQHAGSRILQ
ncbi:aspartate/glutamate racemase family protein [Brevibacillus nitrificans]|uniref:aspartate/glutamate racemase family protein n=1 Tax=Brevibacillus nitrificans TaxID=651560 RepID=UPI00285E5144|nr:aspartate/glutamate racemase family protein [Brevibacillus nitrificans]MDR7316748.1 allantoin racemase [Brevibacillus nitrificans]